MADKAGLYLKENGRLLAIYMDVFILILQNKQLRFLQIYIIINNYLERCYCVKRSRIHAQSNRA